ncbi:MAG: ABC transporter ATP-binding protein [Thermodesulfovibrionales bacterium]|nr:ABC transporter ATP-binding protein [Thermodesulfovibrionales bacterium]
MIRLENISRAFDGKWAVKGLSLEIPEGEIFGLLGPNGAGKTTIMRMMTGILQPTGGKIFIAGHDAAKEPVEAKSVTGYVPDRPFFYEKLTGKEFLIFIASIHRMKKEDAMRRIEGLTGLVDIKAVEDELIEGYSQGMKQRLLFASALVHEPKVILIDEPFVGLDPIGVLLIRDIIKDLASGGATILLATHSLQMASELCHRVGLINKGVLTAVKSRAEVSSAEGGLAALFLKEVSGRPSGEGR